MGFIEDERKRKAAGLEAQRKSESIREQQKREQYQREREETLAVIAQGKKARQHFEQSGLGEMIRKLKEFGTFRSVTESNPETAFVGDNYTHGSYVPSNQHLVEIRFRSERVGKENKIRVEVAPDGTIKIEGGSSKSTIFSEDEWQGKGGPEALEVALEKAYRHPKVVPDHNEPSWQHHPPH